MVLNGGFQNWLLLVPLLRQDSNKLFNGDHIDDVMDNVTQRRLLEDLKIPNW
jgi:hypothetical protein